MDTFKGYSKVLFLSVLLTVFVTGCGGGGGSGAVDPNSAKAITAYSLAGVSGSVFTGTINEPAKTITVAGVPVGTDVTALVATFTTTAKSVMVGTTPQTSSITPNNFTSPVSYTFTAIDGTLATYTVTVVPTTAKTITAYSFVGLPDSPGIINESAKTITVIVPSDTDLTTLTTSAATVTTTAKRVQKGAAALNKLVVAPDGLSATDTITITAADGTSVTYTVIVTKATSSAKAITAFAFVGFTGFPGTINEAAKTITVNLPSGTDVRTLTATFTTAGKTVTVGSAVQTSGAAPTNNFTTPVAYTVTAVDGSSATYTVTVTVAPSSAKEIIAYSFAGFTGAAGIINEAARTIAVTVPNGTDVTALAATFTTTGNIAKVGTAVQTSIATVNNFTTPVAYTVTAVDGSSATYTVTVTIAPSSAKALTAFEFVGFSAYPGIVDEAAKTIAVTLPYGADVTALTAKFTTSGTVVKIGSAVQTSEAPPTNDFTTPKAYTVTAADGTTTLVPYTVTVTIAAANPTAPTLGETARFVILASQRVTTTAGSAISNGDIGIEDQARSYYAGFTPGANPGQFTVLTNGLSYAHDDIDPALIPAPYASTIAFINQVRTDLGIAYSFLAADPNPTAPTQVCPIELGGRTLTRGVYKTGSNVGITTGALHLDAQGDPNAVFIFTTDGTLTIGAPSGGIVLDNLAQAKNVYFRVAGITTIEAGIIAYGNIFSWQQVNLLAGASITGRLFSVNEQVTLIANAVTKAP